MNRAQGGNALAGFGNSAPNRLGISVKVVESGHTMRLAYLILAHERPDRLRRLVQAISADWADIYIHIDARANMQDFVQALEALPVTFIKDRVKVNWLGWSMVEAELRLLRAAVPRQYKYYKLLSAYCYPVKSRAYLRQYYAEHNENFCHFWGMIDPNEDLSKPPKLEETMWTLRIRYYFFIDAIPIVEFLKIGNGGFRTVPVKCFLRHPLRILYWGLFYLLIYYWPFARRLLPKRKKPPNMPFAWGSQWWSLTHDFVVDVLAAIDKDPSLVRFFRYTMLPDELFFQSMLKHLGHPCYSSGATHTHRQFLDITANLLAKQCLNPHILFSRKVPDELLS